MNLPFDTAYVDDVFASETINLFVLCQNFIMLLLFIIYFVGIQNDSTPTRLTLEQSLAASYVDRKTSTVTCSNVVSIRVGKNPSLQK